MGLFLNVETRAAGGPALESKASPAEAMSCVAAGATGHGAQVARPSRLPPATAAR